VENRSDRAWKTCLSALIFFFYANSVNAAGFALIEQDAKGMGNAYAGGAASAEDATTVFYNPAGMTRIKGREFIAGLHTIEPSMRFNNTASSISPSFGGAALTGSDGGDGGVTGFVPNLYYSQELQNGYWAGLGINVPFGLSTVYDSNWKGRYQAVESKIKTLNINPSLAHRFNENLSLGGGVNLQYIEAKLTQAVDFTAVCLGLFGGAACTGQGLGLATLQSTGTAGYSDNSASDWSMGYNAGVLYEFSPQARIGLNYRSKIDHKLTGEGDFTIPSAVSGAGGGIGATVSTLFADAAITTYITLPETLSLSGYQQLNNHWAIMGDVTRTWWSRIPEVRIIFNSPKSDSVERLNWKDSTRYAVGASYMFNERWTMRTGVAYDQTPIYQTTDRTARLPDNDRRWLSFGASYKGSSGMSVDVGYAHLFMSNTPIDRTGALGDTLRGSFQNQVDILSAQLVWNY
jgi:long-chain fatty acid transport protein